MGLILGVGVPDIEGAPPALIHAAGSLAGGRSARAYADAADLIRGQWDELLRVAGSLDQVTVTRPVERRGIHRQLNKGEQPGNLKGA